MRFLGGKYKGRKIEGYAIVGTRPTMDRVKESLFAMIQDSIYESTVLDLFAGTGSLGLEALSRGAKTCYLIDHNPKCIEMIRKTMQSCQIEANLCKTTYQKALENFSKMNQKFDIIFLDPPYEKHIIDEIVTFIYKKELLNKRGLIVCEYETEELVNTCFPVYKERKYGSKKIKIYRNV